MQAHGPHGAHGYNGQSRHKKDKSQQMIWDKHPFAVEVLAMGETG